MNALRWIIAAIVVLVYVILTAIFFLDWGRLVQTTRLSEPALVLHCLWSGGVASAAMAFYFAVKQRTLGVLGSVAMLPFEIAMSYVLIAAGFGYWLSMKLVLFGCLFLLIKHGRN